MPPAGSASGRGAGGQRDGGRFPEGRSAHQVVGGAAEAAGVLTPSEYGAPLEVAAASRRLRLANESNRASDLWWILSSKLMGYSPVGKPSTGCGAKHRRNNTNAWISGREAHQNEGSIANATLIYSNTHDDPKAYTHIPSETRRRTCTIPTPGRHNGGIGAQRATVSGPGL